MTSIIVVLVVAAFYQRITTAASCDSIYTVGDDELCMVSLSSFAESCITFDASYNIAATNGLAMNPLTEDLYVVASIGSNNGDRTLFKLHDATSPASLEAVATYSASNDKLVGIAFDCLGDLYGITGSQADHSFYHVDVADGTLTLIADLDASTTGNALTYDPMNDHFYRVGGETQIDIEELDHYTGNTTADYFITDESITSVRAIGYYRDDSIFVIDSQERLFELDTLSGDVVPIVSLTSTRKHKGIVCSDLASSCAFLVSTTEMSMSTTLVDDDGTTASPDMATSTSANADGDAADRVDAFWSVVGIAFIYMLPL